LRQRKQSATRLTKTRHLFRANPFLSKFHQDTENGMEPNPPTVLKPHTAAWRGEPLEPKDDAARPTGRAPQA
jgi:hypothetical protein